MALLRSLYYININLFHSSLNRIVLMNINTILLTLDRLNGLKRTLEITRLALVYIQWLCKICTLKWNIYIKIVNQTVQCLLKTEFGLMLVCVFIFSASCCGFYCETASSTTNLYYSPLDQRIPWTNNVYARVIYIYGVIKLPRRRANDDISYTMDDV